MNVDEDLRNNNIIINDISPPPSTIPQNNEAAPMKKSFKNAYKNFVNNIKNIAQPKKNSSLPENEQKQNNSNLSVSTDQTPKEETCKDKVANKLIQTIEVQKNLTVFLTLLGLGCLLLCLSIFMLPFIITAPSKFSLCFAFGSVLVLISFLFYHGTKVYITKLFENKRFWVTVTFLISIILGIFFSLGKHYFLSLFCSLFQLIALVMFVLSFLPGGQGGIKMIRRTVTSPFAKVFMGMVQNEVNNNS